MVAHPLAPLSATEFQSTAAKWRRDQGVTDSWRFASIELKEPPKAEIKPGGRAMECHGGRFRSYGTGSVNGQVEVPAGGQVNVTIPSGLISLLFGLRLLVLGLVSCGRSRRR